MPENCESNAKHPTESCKKCEVSKTNGGFIDCPYLPTNTDICLANYLACICKHYAAPEPSEQEMIRAVYISKRSRFVEEPKITRCKCFEEIGRAYDAGYKQRGEDDCQVAADTVGDDATVDRIHDGICKLDIDQEVNDG